MTTAWDEILPGVHAHDDRRGVWSVRTHAIELRDGTLALASPTRGLPAAVHEALGELGEPSLFLAPNHYHHLGLPEWLTRHREARAVAGYAARPRLSRQQPHIDFGPLDALTALLPPHVSALEPPGLRSGEVWLRVEGEDGVAWIVGDAFFAQPVLPSGVAGALFRLTDTAPGLKIGRTFTTLAVRDGTSYRAWLLERLARDEPTTLVPSHGDVLEGEDLAERLRALAERRL